MAQTLLISGTDTEIGKTVITSSLLSYWQMYRSHESVAVCKPVQSGPGDRERYTHLFQLQQSAESINPVYFEQPLAPPLAADHAGQTIDLLPAWLALQRLQSQFDWVLVEALGGLGSPVTHELTVADLARDWRLPILLVVPIRLGCIGQAVAHVALARQSQLEVKGIILNAAQPFSPTEIQQWAPVAMIESLTQVPVLGMVPYLDDLTHLEQLATVASQLDLEALGDLSYAPVGP
ncbi:dethiobiotin synthase [Acaryochloris sp. IP29b_bin.148]|uniref:dethiobiotin synthase n=1 Tax=Acaryochloris sp. IP29b_bin.148 TaxID=2969218 RepID=UPI00263290A3|nr:dethiobiotin synthase [Acaryochloris sp. IP29b_bin.148]